MIYRASFSHTDGLSLDPFGPISFNSLPFLEELWWLSVLCKSLILLSTCLKFARNWFPTKQYNKGLMQLFEKARQILIGKAASTRVSVLQSLITFILVRISRKVNTWNGSQQTIKQTTTAVTILRTRSWLCLLITGPVEFLK